MVLHDLALVMVLLAWAARRGQSPVTVLAYAWNPLVLVEYAGSGHNDPTALLWMALAFLWLDSRPIASAIALALGALVKLAPLVALPFLLRRWPWRARLACLALLAAGLGWFWTETRGPSSGLSAYWGAWRNNELLFHYFEGMTGSYATARSVAGASTVTASPSPSTRTSSGSSRPAAARTSSPSETPGTWAGRSSSSPSRRPGPGSCFRSPRS